MMRSNTARDPSIPSKSRDARDKNNLDRLDRRPVAIDRARAREVKH